MCHFGCLTRYIIFWKLCWCITFLVSYNTTTTLVLNTKHTLQAVLQTPSLAPGQPANVCDAGIAEQQMQQEYVLQHKLLECGLF